jgi:hypothetical protein
MADGIRPTDGTAAPDGSVSGITSSPGVTNALNNAPADGSAMRLGTTPTAPAPTGTPIATPTPAPADGGAPADGSPLTGLAGTVTGDTTPNFNPESGMFGYASTMPGGVQGPVLGQPLDPNGAGLPNQIDPNANAGMFTPNLSSVLNNAIDTGSPTDGASADGNISTTPGTP